MRYGKGARGGALRCEGLLGGPQFVRGRYSSLGGRGKGRGKGGGQLVRGREEERPFAVTRGHAPLRLQAPRAVSGRGRARTMGARAARGAEAVEGGGPGACLGLFELVALHRGTRRVQLVREEGMRHVQLVRERERERAWAFLSWSLCTSRPSESSPRAAATCRRPPAAHAQRRRRARRARLRTARRGLGGLGLKLQFRVWGTRLRACEAGVRVSGEAFQGSGLLGFKVRGTGLGAGEVDAVVEVPEPHDKVGDPLLPRARAPTLAPLRPRCVPAVGLAAFWGAAMAPARPAGDDQLLLRLRRRERRVGDAPRAPEAREEPATLAAHAERAPGAPRGGRRGAMRGRRRGRGRAAPCGERRAAARRGHTAVGRGEASVQLALDPAPVVVAGLDVALMRCEVRVDHADGPPLQRELHGDPALVAHEPCAARGGAFRGYGGGTR